KTMATSRDPYELHGAIAVARAIDRLVDDATRPAWQAWLAPRFATVLAPAARFGQTHPRVAGTRIMFLRVPVGRAGPLPLPPRRPARAIIDGALAKKTAPPPSAVLAADPDSDALGKLAALAHVKDRWTSDAAIEGLGGTSHATEVVTLVIDDPEAVDALAGL